MRTNKQFTTMDPYQSLSPDGGLNLSTTLKASNDIFEIKQMTSPSLYQSVEIGTGNDQESHDSETWKNGLESKEPEDLVTEKWNKFLESLHAKFSEYEIQKDRRYYNVADLEDWGKPGKTQGIVVNSESFGIFMDKISGYGLSDYNELKNITPTEFQLEQLKNVLDFTLNYRVNIRCEDENLYVKGNYVSMLEIMNQRSDKQDSINNCGNYLDLLQSGKLKALNFFALNSVFIDSDVSYPLNVISPIWEVMGNRKFDIKGAQGPPHSKPAAPDGTRGGKNGEHGKPGLPGKPGGTFFGIGSTFINGANLTISVNGGKGGLGQKGGTGGVGFPGYNGAPPRESGNLEDVLGNGITADGFKWEKSYYSKYDQNDLPHTAREMMRGLYPLDTFFHEAYTFFGKPGEKGGDGGNGGRGGKGGEPGIITLIAFDDPSEVMEQADCGEEGEVGKGGSGGKSGETGNDLIARVYVQRPAGFQRMQGQNDYLWWVPKEYIPNKSHLGPEGKNGVDGANYTGRQDPESGLADKRLDNILNECKIFIRENLVNNPKKSELLQFLYNINSNKNVTSVYHTLGLVSELTGMEKQFQKLVNHVDFAPFYESMLNRTSDYAKNPKEGEDSREFKKVLSYLYTAILSRMGNLREESKSSLIINIGGYLDLAKKDIETLKDLQNQNNKAEIINRYKENYKKGVDAKISEANFFIQKQITPEIGNVKNEIDEKIDLLIKETIMLQEKAEEEKEALIKKKEELESALALRGLFSGLKLLGEVVSFLGPVGAVVGTVIETTASVADSLLLNNASQMLQFTPNVIPDLKHLADQAKSVKNQKVVYLNNLIEQISLSVNSNPKKFGDIYVNLRNIKIRIAKACNEKFNVNELNGIEAELKKVLKKKEDDMASEKDDSTQTNTKALATIKKFSQILKLGPQVFDIYNKYKGDQTKIDTLTSAVTQAENKLQKLKEYEENIYDALIPMFQNLETNLYEVADKLSTKSQVSLDVTKWRIQSTLKDIKLQIQQTTDGFEVKEGLARCIEKLDEVMTTLINIYDRIQNYQEQQNLANYIADISSVSASNIHITNPELVNATNRLEESIRSNIVLKEYRTSLDAFEQWVFPFAEYYLGKSVLPSHLNLDKNIEDLVSNAADKIEIMKQKIDLYKTSVKNTDKYLQNGEFSSRWKSTDPFFVWKNENYKDEISKLLSGQEVVLKSDVKSSAIDKDAIKFSVIDLVFKSRNETLQPQLTDALKDFDIRAKHLGNSYYRYANEIYLITSDSQTILYSYEKNSAGEPVRRNNVFDKIKSGDLMLSPYTLWEIKLRNSTGRSSFDELKIFKNEIDLELSGHGSYVLKDVDLSVMRNTSQKSKHKVRYDKNEIQTNRNKRDSFEIDKIFDRFMTNGASTTLSSPINYISNLLKTYVLSNVVFTLHRMFPCKEITIANKNNPISVQKDSNKVSINIVDDETERKIETTHIGLKSHKTKNNRLGIISEYCAKDKTVLSTDECCKEQNVIDLQENYLDNWVVYADNTDNLKSCLLGEKQELQNNQLVQVPDINCSLLLADLISRTMTRNKYKTPVNESFLSPQEVIERKISNQIMRSELEIKQHLLLLESENDDNEILGFNRVKGFINTAFQFLGFG